MVRYLLCLHLGGNDQTVVKAVCKVRMCEGEGVRGVTMCQNVDGAQLCTRFLSHSTADETGYWPITSCAVGDSLHYLALLIQFIDCLCMLAANCKV